MSSNRISDSLTAGVHEMRSSWGWFMALGLLLVLIGVICIIGDVTATFVTIIAFGWLLLLGGVVSLIQAFRVHNWSGFLLYLLSALLRGFTGYVLIRYPTSGAAAVTLIIASFFIVGGLFRAVGAGMMRFPRWGWSLFSGIVSVALGSMLLAQMPTSSLWFIGFAIGVDMILEGAALVGFASSLHHLPDTAPYYKAA